MIYLVRAKGSVHYTSTNDDAYLALLQASALPWYYTNYVRTLWLGEGEPKIPCDLDGNPVPRSRLQTDDRNLYSLHLRAVKSFRKSGKPYWMVDEELAKSFEQHWMQVTK